MKTKDELFESILAENVQTPTAKKLFDLFQKICKMNNALMTPYSFAVTEFWDARSDEECQKWIDLIESGVIKTEQDYFKMLYGEDKD